MATFKEKTESLLEHVIYCEFNTQDGTDKARELIRKALKEQDRDTRHACAEAVIQQGEAPAIELIDRCHNACMNAVSS